MELYQLHTFVTVREENSISGAARRLYTTPSAVSMHIKSLEDELGIQLFTRTNQGMNITPKGELLYEKAIRTLRAAQDIIDEASDIRNTLMGSVSVGLCTDAVYLKIPALIEQLQQNYPGLLLSLEKSTSVRIAEAVNAKQLDIGLVFGRVSQASLRVQQLECTELVVAIPAAWDNTFDPSDWEELARQPWISTGSTCPFQQMLVEHLQTHSLSCQNLVHAHDDRNRFDLVAAGLGLSLLERDSTLQGQEQGLMSIAPVTALSCPLSVIYRTDEAENPRIRCIAEMLHKLFAVPQSQSNSRNRA